MAILVGFTCTLLFGGWATLEGELEVGLYSVLVFMTQRLLWPLTEIAEMLDLYQSDGIIAEPAGALASAALDDVEIADGELVLAILSGGNNDVSRYAEVVERSLVYEGRKHYFLVEFPQEPGQLRRFLDEILGPDDDITLFEYTKRSNRETGPALVGLELGEPAGLEPLLERMAESAMRTERVDPDSPLFRMVL